jgi:two-component system, OmpR family, sensor histidine kinase BaeS
MRRARGLGGRIALAAFAVALAAVATIAAGILVLGSRLFEELMMAHGESRGAAQAMWDQTVVTVFAVAAVVALVVSVALGLLLGGMISRPLEKVGAAARRLAVGDYSARAPRSGSAELRSLADSFNQMAETLEQQERERSELVANFAHELRTPLTNLGGYLEAMRDGVMRPSPEVFDSLREEVDRLERLSRSLDELSGEGLRVADPSDLDLAAAVRNATELARPAFERSGLTLGVDLPSTGLPLVRAVPDHLSQVLANLLQNAQRYTPPGGTVTVGVAAEHDTVLVHVTNSGSRIPAQDLPRVFERFYRVDKSRDRARGGAGIGLAIVKQLVEQAGGRVGAESGRDGTRFWIRLRAGEQVVGEAGPPHRPPPAT